MPYPYSVSISSALPSPFVNITFPAIQHYSTQYICSCTTVCCVYFHICPVRIHRMCIEITLVSGREPGRRTNSIHSHLAAACHRHPNAGWRRRERNTYLKEKRERRERLSEWKWKQIVAFKIKFTLHNIGSNHFHSVLVPKQIDRYIHRVVCV